MDVSSIANITATNADLAAFGIPPKANAEEVAQSFESLFASQLISEMRKTLPEGLFGSEQSDILGGMFDLHMGQAITEGGGLGVKELVLAQWKQSMAPTGKDEE